MLQKGFTIIEALIVILILGILAMFTIGAITKSPDNIMIEKELTQFEKHLDSVKDKDFIIIIDGKEYKVKVKIK
jgi:prepilin-type N-terminal cleavage/methylation domain-containing protein